MAINFPSKKRKRAKKKEEEKETRRCVAAMDGWSTGEEIQAGVVVWSHMMACLTYREELSYNEVNGPSGRNNVWALHTSTRWCGALGPRPAAVHRAGVRWVGIVGPTAQATCKYRRMQLQPRQVQVIIKYARGSSTACITLALDTCVLSFVWFEFWTNSESACDDSSTATRFVNLPQRVSYFLLLASKNPRKPSRKKIWQSPRQQTNTLVHVILLRAMWRWCG